MSIGRRGQTGTTYATVAMPAGSVGQTAISNVPKPSGAAVGDLVIVYARYDINGAGAGSADLIPSTGWTNAGGSFQGGAGFSGSTNDYGDTLFWRQLTGGAQDTLTISINQFGSGSPWIASVATTSVAYRESIPGRTWVRYAGGTYSGNVSVTGNPYGPSPIPAGNGAVIFACAHSRAGVYFSTPVPSVPPVMLVPEGFVERYRDVNTAAIAESGAWADRIFGYSASARSVPCPQWSVGNAQTSLAWSYGWQSWNTFTTVTDPPGPNPWGYNLSFGQRSGL